MESRAAQIEQGKYDREIDIFPMLAIFPVLMIAQRVDICPTLVP